MEEQAQTAQRHQQECAEENVALKHEIQVRLHLIALVVFWGRRRGLAGTSRTSERRTAYW